LVKFADDLTLVTLAAATVSVEAEFASVHSWARDNKLQINLAKTKEIVITRCGRRGFMQPPLIPGVARENLVKLLGITVNNHLFFADHVRKLQTVARQRLYLLQLLKRQGLDTTCLDVVFKAIVSSTIVYAMPAFSGNLTESVVNMLQAVINKAFKLGYLSSIPDLRSLISRADRQLSNKLNTNAQHCLAPFLPSERNLETRSTLRARGHRFCLPHYKSKSFKDAYLNRVLFLHF